MGLLLNTEESYHGYTLFGNNEDTYLVDNCGNVVNTWRSNYKTGHGMYFLNNGDLLRQGALPGEFDVGGRGGIFELFDWDGTIKWSITIASDRERAHHDLAVMPNGNFLCTVWEKHSEDESRAKGWIHTGELWAEKILEIEIMPNDNYNIVWYWSSWDHMIQDVNPNLSNYGVISEHPELLNINYLGDRDEIEGNWLHVNAIDYNSDLDQIVFSSRFLNEIYVIDHSTTIEEAAGHTGGRSSKGGDILYRYGNPQAYELGNDEDQVLQGQHNIRWIPKGHKHEGNFIVFNNEFDTGLQSSVDIFQSPVDSLGVYHYTMSKGYGPDTLIRRIIIDGIYSDILSAAQPLDNGNILITEGRDGNFVEVSTTDEIVWHYINPVNRNGSAGVQGGQPRFNLVFKAERYPLHFEGFESKDLTAVGTVEVSFDDYECNLYGSNITTAVETPENDVQVYYDIMRQELVLSDKATETFDRLQIISISGTTLIDSALDPYQNRIPLRSNQLGLFIVHLYSQTQQILLKVIIY